jgi:hypothetical protein
LTIVYNPSVASYLHPVLAARDSYEKLCAVLALLGVICGCGRSPDNARGFDQALQDVENGVEKSPRAVSGEYQKGYREAIDKLDKGIQQFEQHKTDQQRAKESHERVEQNGKR